MPVSTDKILNVSENESSRFRRAWNESHGNLLLGFAGLIFVIGTLVIWLSPPPIADPEIDLTGPVDPVGVPAGTLPDSLVIRVTTDRLESKGPIRIAVFETKESFGDPQKALLKEEFIPVEGFALCGIELDRLPEDFAVAAYHDLDNNGELNRGLFNIPVEPYGFSNNAPHMVGPPTFEQTVMRRPTKATVIEIRVY